MTLSMSGVTALAATTPQDGWIGSWSPGIGDPTVAGWITVFAYFAASLLCWRVYRNRLARAGSSSVPGFALVVLPWLLALLAIYWTARRLAPRMIRRSQTGLAAGTPEPM
jgi:hypothetical protein